jgi:hypothetical protein
VGEVVGGAQRQNTERNIGAGNPAGGVGHRPVAAADDHQIVPVRKHPVKRPGQVCHGQYGMHRGDGHSCLPLRFHGKFVCRPAA